MKRGLQALIGLSVMLALVIFREWLGYSLGDAIHHLSVTLSRLIPPVIIGGVLGLGLSAMMRRNPHIESTLTPWLLSLLAIPWLLVIPAVNIIPYVGLSETTILVLATLILTIKVAAAYGRSKQPTQARGQLLRQGVRLVLATVLVAELFSRTNGVGSQLRYYALFWNPPHFVLYVVLAFGLWGVIELSSWGMARLWGSKRQLA